MPYELRTTEPFDLQVEHWAGSMERWDEIWFNFDYDLVSHPYSGPLIPNTYMRALPLETNPPLTVYYHVNEQDKIITLLQIAEA